MPIISSLHSWVDYLRPRTSRPVSRRSRLRLETLEGREVPAGPTLVASNPINTGHMTGNQSEPAIAVNPLNPKQQFVSTNDNAGNFMYGSVSSDGGNTW